MKFAVACVQTRAKIISDGIIYRISLSDPLEKSNLFQTRSDIYYVFLV